jgi:tripartite-type tricarboxylate transporter receptor subunit TctC
MAALLSILLLVSARGASAEDIPYFRGKTVSLIYGGGAGGGYRAYANLLGPFLVRHLDGGPRIVVKGVPGAGTFAAANYIYEVAASDGTEIAAVAGNTATAALFRTPNIRFNPRRLLWIGSMTSDVGVAVAWYTSGVTTIEQLRTRTMVVGGGGPISGNVIFPTVLNRLFGMKFEIVRGYPSSSEAMAAVERGELDGVASWNYSSIRAGHMDLVREGKVTLLLQLGLGRHPDLPDIPAVTDLVRTPEQRGIVDLVFAPEEMARPFAVSPATKPQIVSILRRAFDETMADASFLAEAERLHLDISHPMTGDAVTRLIGQLYALPPELVAKSIDAADTGNLP